MIQGKRIAAVILARAASRRLEHKMMLPFGGSTVIETAIERLRACSVIDDFVLATSTNPADDVFAPLAARAGIGFFRGSEDDVVGRMTAALETLHTRPDVIVRGCADNPLLMPTVVEEGIALLVGGNADLVTPFEDNTYPFGYSLVAMTAQCLGRIEREATAPLYREHVENFCFDHPQRFKVQTQRAPDGLRYPELCLTLDYAVDYDRLRLFAGAALGLPMDRQPGAVIDAVGAARVGVILGDRAPEDRLRAVIAREVSTEPLFFTSANDAGREELDLVIGARPVAGDPEPSAPRGAVWVGPERDGRRQLLCRLGSGSPYVAHDDAAVADEDAAACLARVLPAALRHLLAGPPRPLDARHRSGEKTRAGGPITRATA